jgi:UDP-glucose 4-epimerase
LARPVENNFYVGDIGADTDWRRALEGVDAVVHLAGPAEAQTSEAELRRAVVEGSSALASQAFDLGVKRFLYVSSIKACAERAEAPVAETTPAGPLTNYGRAKLAAEGAVLDRFPHAIVLRPPLVHGPGVRGKLARLLALLASDVPLPLAGFTNRRSMISKASFCEAVLAALTASETNSGVFHLTDHPAVSTSELVSLLRKGLGRPPRLFQIPGIASLAPAAIGASLEVDDARFRAAFQFSGADTSDALVRTAEAWRAAR